MPKRTQLNININEKLLKALKISALKQNKNLSDLVTDILESFVYKLGKIDFSKPFSDRDALNCTKFMKALFNKKFELGVYNNKEIAFEEFIFYVEKFNQWDKIYTPKLKTVMLSESSEAWSSKELNLITSERNCECPIYAALKEWTGCSEFPSQDLICDLGKSLIPVIEANIK
ncbi:hypothetical protein CU313_05625 [Prochlorococcus marinus str. MU1404]|uniref:hypothetical protein n=1 Tax=Prochlorococcus marinus TaxID=1219 RepID=UPI001ADC8C37|nr:hypothetical protein [Prochlorococcus marinus]MBO8229868.1 hypothetical protein [Prochlorococcus marinus XMU1404]MBW3073347.1 hypothetical protein [Prochlorococcus marinus str. MU1404]MCR8545796.1 hypothetical protein [Prochlorococcus marinus CUG1432]